MNSQKSYRRAFVFVAILFFLWGFTTVLIDSLIPRLRDMFMLNYFEAGLVRFAFFIPYLLFSIPAYFLLVKIGYKRGVTLGLLMMALGCFLFYPAAAQRLMSVYVLAIFVLATGITFLQVAANPYISTLGEKLEKINGLNVSQMFNALGATIAPLIGAIFILSNPIESLEEISVLSAEEQQIYLETEAAVVQIPFMNIGIFVMLLAIIFAFVKLPRIAKDSEKTSLKDYFSLFKKQSLLFGSVAIFLYVGAEVAIGSYLINYFAEIGIVRNILENKTMYSLVVMLGKIFGIPDFEHSDSKAIVAIFVMFYWGGAMVGRFVGFFLIKRVLPARILIISSLSAILLIIISINTEGLFSMWSILAVGLFNSMMFPTIFALASDNLGELKPQALGILCMMIVGGAIIPPIFGFFVDNIGFKMAFLTLVVCYGMILFYGYYKRFVNT
ncbi:MAG: sugar MFS transporter [Capnocytophaga sp.]|nr:sugar MFS transporter [Capnocytophaga sp.]